MRLADGRYRCPECQQAHDEQDMHSGLTYCRPCFRSKARVSHALRVALRRAGVRPRPRGNQPPEGFAEQARGRTDATLAGLYCVSDVTIRNWRKALGIKPSRTTLPENFAELARGMTGLQVAAKWGVHRGTAYKWLREVETARRGAPVPADWADTCARMGVTAAAQRYGVSPKVARKWSKMSGVAPLKRPQGMRRARTAPAAPPRPELPSARPVQPVYVHTNGCRECTSERLCRAHQMAQLNADVEAWMAAGNRPREVPQGATGIRMGWGAPR